MQFQPKTEKEIEEENLWPIGIYDYEIFKGLDKQSKSGNDMIELGIYIYNDEGNRKIVNDYLLEAISYKLRHAAYASGLGDKYEVGSLTGFDFEGTKGQLKLGIQKDKNGQYPDKNVVSDYLTKKDEKPKKVAKASNEMPADLDDEVPF